MLDLICAAAFEAAKASQIGYIVESNSAFRARMKLYNWRAENAPHEYATIQLKLSPDNPEHDIWLINLPDDNTKFRNPRALTNALRLNLAE